MVIVYTWDLPVGERDNSRFCATEIRLIIAIWCLLYTVSTNHRRHHTSLHEDRSGHIRPMVLSIRRSIVLRGENGTKMFLLDL